MLDKRPSVRRKTQRVVIVDRGRIVEVPSKSNPGHYHKVKPHVPFCPCKKWEFTNSCDHIRIAHAALKKAGYLRRVA